MKNQAGGQHLEGCKCGMCQGKTCGTGGGCWGKYSCWYHIIRWILGIVIIVIVFCFGMMIGQLKGELGRSSGYRMMRTSSYGNYGRAYPMMQNGQGGMMGGATGRSQTAPSAQSAPAAPSANQ